MGHYQAKRSKQGYSCYADLGCAFSVNKSFQRFFSSSSSWYREEDTFTNGDFPYKCKYLL